MRHPLRTLLLAGALTASGAGLATAQPPPSAQTPPPAPPQAIYNWQQLPSVQGRVAQYSLTPRGDVDGLILDNGTEVHFPPHLGTQLVYVVRPGDTVTVHGLEAMGVPMVQAMSITNDATGQTVVDTGPPGPPGPRGRRGRPPGGGMALTDQSTIKTRLYGPQGDLNGVLLADGTIVHMPPPVAQQMAAQLTPGQPLYVSGTGYAGPLGKAIDAQMIGPSQAQATALPVPPPPWQFAGGPPPPPPGGAPPPPAPPR
jgi:hypothetical protein